MICSLSVRKRYQAQIGQFHPQIVLSVATNREQTLYRYLQIDDFTLGAFA
jgi:hypothetical protein